MDKIGGTIPFYPLELTKEGKVFKPAEKEAILAAVKQTGTDKITDLVVVSHGWNNNREDAKGLYDKLFDNVGKLLSGSHKAKATGHRLAVVGIFWPSKRFEDADLVAGGGEAAASGGGGTAARATDATSAALKARIDRLVDTFDKPGKKELAKAKALVDKLDSVASQREFVDLIRSLLPQNPTAPGEDRSDVFLELQGDELLQRLVAPIRQRPRPSPGQGGGTSLRDTSMTRTASGGAAGFGDFLNGMKAAAWRFLNYATFYQMKERAGVVGAALNGVMKDVRAAAPDLKIHLVGHSFGARLVTAAAAGAAKFDPASMLLLQGAFSHNGFAGKFDGTHDGFFRNVITQGRVKGPIAATYTANDQAVGLLYPIAVRFSGDNSLALGDANDVFGGLGRNGAVKMKQEEFTAIELLPATGGYSFKSGIVHNLLADAFIADHNAVTGPECANALLSVEGM